MPAATTSRTAGIAVTTTEPSLAHAATILAQQLDLPLATQTTTDSSLLLTLTPQRLELRETGPTAAGPVYSDFLTGAAHHRRHAGGQALARAAGIRHGRQPNILDATAGLGQDAFILASLGCHVRLIERSPVVAALLADGLARAASDLEVGPIIARMQLQVGDAASIMKGLQGRERPAVITLDPMYPPSRKSALKNKQMRLFRMLVGNDPDAPQLLQAALACATDRVVLKRPQKAPTLAGPPPSTTIPGKTTRYDLYLTPRRNP